MRPRINGRVAVAVAVGLLMSSAATGQPPPQESGKKQFYYGVQSCSGCHSQERSGNYLCRFTEVPIWKKDKHAFAYEALEGDRATRMGDLLGYKVTKKQECLTCHSVWANPPPPTTFKREEGVSCVACHGSELLAAPDKNKLAVSWIAYHSDEASRTTWRDLKRSIKEKEYGMADLWDFEKRSRLCVSCHIGNAKENKVVTHDMYAAGHPPLPGFEVVTFSAQMPQHWQYLKDKREDILSIVKIDARTAELEESHLLALGALVAFQETLGLLEAKIGTASWPDYAMFDCYACHHEPQTKSWRQKRGYAGKPGRPPLRQWSTTLVELGLQHVAADSAGAANLLAEFRKQLTALQTAVDAKPFGEPGTVKTQSRALRDWLGKQVQQIQIRINHDDKIGGYDLKASAKLLDYLIAMRRPSGREPDFDSARQLAWAYQVLFRETGSQRDLHAQPSWRELDKYLRLTLPQDRAQMEDSIGLNLERLGRYEPRQFYKLFDEVLKVRQD
jgi:hypothetical protein